MTESTKPTPIISHTLETLCNELVSGRGVIIDEDGNVFQLTTSQERAIFEWYRANRDKWAKNVMKADVEGLTDSIKNTPPDLPATVTADTSDKKIFHLKSITAHRFAGIHKFKEPQSPPNEFHFDFTKPFHLIQGRNGSGKTSLLSAICWCLCGSIYRTQRPPETIANTISLETDGDGNGNFNMSPITPIPRSSVLSDLDTKYVPLDTWVEVKLEDDQGQEYKIKRSVSRTNRGKLIISNPDLSELNLDPNAFEIGTKMTGLIPYIQLEETSDLGAVVAEITGIQPLKDLSKHAKKTQVKLQNDFPKEKEKEIGVLNKHFEELKIELEEEIKSTPSIDPEVNAPTLKSDNVGEVLKNLKEIFEVKQSVSLSQCKTILGDSFDSKDRAKRAELLKAVKPALGQLSNSNIGRLPSASMLKSLGSVEEETNAQIELLIKKYESESLELLQLKESPQQAVRMRLYAKISEWYKDHPELSLDMENCPVCDRSLKDIIDPKTGQSVIDHISQHLEKDSVHLGKTVKVWEGHAINELRAFLPNPYQTYLVGSYPSEPSELIFNALCEELFEAECFNGCLETLKSDTTELCRKELAILGSLDDSDECALADCIKDRPGGLKETINKVNRAIAFSRWRRKYTVECKIVFNNVVGSYQEDGDTQVDQKIELECYSLSDRLNRLNSIIDASKPIESALTIVKKMAGVFNKYDAIIARIDEYKNTAEALEKITQIEDLVEKQVSLLMKKLLSDTQDWKNNIYRSAFEGAPLISDTDVSTDGRLLFKASVGGTKASAKHISSASDLKASLLSFLLAFWKHFIDNRGGLSVLLLDDLQELFDQTNRRRIAGVLPDLVDSGVRAIVTTNDRAFGDLIYSSFKRKSKSDNISRLRVFPLKSIRHHIELGEFSEVVEDKKRIFKMPESENEAQPARDYINCLRIYLEKKLIDLFDQTHPGLPEKPTLANLIGAIHSRNKNGIELYTSMSFINLINDPALKQDSNFLYLLNESHHHRDENITYPDVIEVEDDCSRVMKLVDSVHEEYELWLRRDPIGSHREKPEMPSVVIELPPKDDVPIVLDLAAFTADDSASDTYIDSEGFSFKYLSDRLIYKVHTHNFGFSVPVNCQCLVNPYENDIPDNSLVIALHKDKVYARRLHSNPTQQNIIALSSDAENPTNRPPTVFLRAEEVRLLKVVGIFFDSTSIFPRPREEASLIEEYSFINQIEAVFKVSGNSAVPLALPGQMVFGGKILTPHDLDRLEGAFAAVSTSGGSFLKRIGMKLPEAPHIRHFYSIGSLGESMIVRIEDVGDEQGMFAGFETARIILGVLYE